MSKVVRSFVVALALTALAAPAAVANHFVADCPLSFVGSAVPGSPFEHSPHGVFKSGSLIYSLRGQRLVTLSTVDTGEVKVVRNDLIATMGDREHEGAAAFSNGFLFVSGEAGLEIFDLRNTKEGGSAPVLVSRTAGLHYRRLAISGSILAGLYPATDLPCYPLGTAACANSIDIFGIGNLSAPTLLSRISSASSFYIGFNDIAFANGYLWATGFAGTHAWSLTNPAAPAIALATNLRGTFLATNGTNVMGIGQDTQIGLFTVGPGASLREVVVFKLPSIVDRSNPLAFHRQAWMEDSRLIAMIDELDPETRKPARTIAFDVFDFSVPFYEGFDDRIYENVSYTYPDEVKWDPITLGGFVYVTGEMSGLQVWGACGVANGEIAFDSLKGLTCGGAEIHGWVTGPQRITKVELFLDATLVGTATITDPRHDVSSPTLVNGWHVPVNFDDLSAGPRVLRAVATDMFGNKRQFASKVIQFNGPGENCTTRRRASKR